MNVSILANHLRATLQFQYIASQSELAFAYVKDVIPMFCSFIVPEIPSTIALEPIFSSPIKDSRVCQQALLTTLTIFLSPSLIFYTFGGSSFLSMC